MKCRNCNANNRTSARFCSYCGRMLERPCPACGTWNAPTARFCDKCGKALLEAPSIGTADDDPQGERKLVSVLFADTAGFTSLAESLDPEEVAQVMQECLAILSREIERFRGRVTQFTGDGVMALFGAPNADEDHAIQACHAGVAIRSAILHFSQSIFNRFGTQFKMRVGINSGVAVVGSVDSGSGTEYTALGDTINIASRIESVTPPGAVCCSGDTFRLTKDFFKFESMGNTKIKGKTHPIELYKIFDAKQMENRLEAAEALDLTPFVGRHGELGELVEVFNMVRSETGRVVSIVGEAGVGKSRLLLEFINSLPDKEYMFLLGECVPFGSSIAYLPLLALLRAYFGIKEGAEPYETEGCIRTALTDGGHDPSLLLPPLLDVLSLPAKDQSYEILEPRRKRDRIFHSLSQLFLKASEIRPLIVAIENLTWIDRTSEEFIAYLGNLLSGGRILLVLIHRPGYVHSWPRNLPFTRLGIDQLPPDKAPQLIGSLLDAPPSSDLLDLLIKSSGGNPLFMEELTKTLLEKGYIRKRQNVYSRDSDFSVLPIPATIHGIIAARIDHLPHSLKNILQFAAVMGKHFSRAILQTAMNEAYDLTEGLHELQRMDIVYQENSTCSADSYRFKHDLVQEVAYNSLLLRKRKEIHEAVARTIENSNSEVLDQVHEILAYHFSKGINKEKAYFYLKQSGAKNIRNSSLWEAFRFYKQALILADDRGLAITKQEGLETRLQMTSAMISLGFPENSLEILKEAETIARGINDTRGLTSIVSMIGLYYSVRGNTLQGVKFVEQCLMEARETEDVDLVAPIVFDLCSNYAARGEFTQLAEIAPVALSLLKKSGKLHESFSRGYNIYSAILAFYAFGLGFLGEFERAASFFQEGLAIARQPENLYSLALNEILYGYIFCQKGDGNAALTHFESGVRYLDRGQIVVLMGLAWNGIGRARYFLGDLEDALACAEKGFETHTHAGITYNLSAHFWFLALVHLELGDLVQAQKKLDESLRLAKANREPYYLALSKMLSAKIGLRSAAISMSQATRLVRQALRMLIKQGVRPQVAIGHLFLADLSFRAGHDDKSIQDCNKARAMFDSMGMAYWTEKAKMFMDQIKV